MSNVNLEERSDQHCGDASETIEWIAAVRIIESALVDFSDRLSENDTIALERSWRRILRG